MYSPYEILKHFSSMLKEEKSVDAFIGYALSKQFNLSIINTTTTYSFAIWEHSVPNYSVISLYFSGMICYFIFHNSLVCLANFKEFYGVCFYKYHIFHDVF